MTIGNIFRSNSQEPESPYAWLRLAASLVIGAIGGVGMWSAQVALPAVQAEFGVDRAAASVPYTVTMICAALAPVAIGRLVDRFGIFIPLVIAIFMICIGYVAASLAPTLLFYTLAQGILVGAGAAVFFAPMMADISHWFVRRRGIAVAAVATGNYFAGVVWPIPFQQFINLHGWRAAHLGVAAICLVTLLPLALVLRRRPLLHDTPAGSTQRAFNSPALGFSPNTLQVALCIAGLACCVAMAMPQVHIVAYCGDLGYGVARGTDMLSLMLGFGIVSRLASGFIADRIGGLATWLLGSVLQGSSLVLYFFFDGLTSLYVISAIFGLVQGGIVPSYAIIVREYFPPKEAATRVGICIMATMFGMALGGWMSGVIFDLTGSYRAAFANGIAFNLLNVAIALLLMRRPGGTAARLARV
jgi:MFS family permease